MPSTAYIGKVWQDTQKKVSNLSSEGQKPQSGTSRTGSKSALPPLLPLNFLPFSRMLRMQTSLSA